MTMTMATRNAGRFVRAQGYDVYDSARVEAELRNAGNGCNLPRAMRERPLKIGDAEQIGVIRAMNGEMPYCSTCFGVVRGGCLDDVGRQCAACGGVIIPGAKIEAAWRRSYGRRQPL